MGKIPCPLNAAARAFDTLPAIIAGTKVISYREYENMAATAAVGLRKQGVRTKQRIAIIANNCWEFVVLVQALLRLGAVACPVSPRFPQESILAILEKINCSVVIDMLNKLSPTSSLTIQRIGLDDILPFDNIEGQEHDGGAEVDVDSDNDATIILTSGSAALPKAALHSFGNHYYSALGSNRNIAIEPGDRWLLSLPLYHVGGLGIIFRMLLGGGTVVIPEGKEEIGVSMDTFDITHLSLVPTQLCRLLTQRVNAGARKRLKAVLVGGGPVPLSLVGKACEAGLPLFTTYGLTEMASQVTTTGSVEPNDRLFTSGRVLEYRSLKIDQGEIMVKGKTLFKGYVERENTVLPVDGDGWFRTGDLGRLDGKGYLIFLGRRDNMFISGGENICPEEIEGFLCGLPDVSGAIVVPIEDKEFGHRPLAFVRMEGGKRMDEKEVVSCLEQRLPRFKLPVAFHPWPEEADKSGIKPDRLYLARLAQRLRD